MLVELEWEPLQDRRKNIRLVLLFKIQKGVVKGVDSQRFLEINTSKTRSSASGSSYKHIRTNTKLASNAFYPRTVRDWGGLPPDTQQKATVEAFKSALPKACY